MRLMGMVYRSEPWGRVCVSFSDTGNRAERALTDLYVERLLFNFHGLL